MKKRRASADDTVERVVGRRLQNAAACITDACIFIDRYIDIGCPPAKEGKRYTVEASKTPSLLERGRMQVVTAAINVEAAMLALMMVPVLNTGVAVEMAKTIRGLPKRRRQAIVWLMRVHSALSEATQLAGAAELLTHRVALRKDAQAVYELCEEAILTLDREVAL